MTTTTPMTYEELQEAYVRALHGCAIISGTIVGPSDRGWRVIAQETAQRLRVMADGIEAVANGQAQPAFPVFPCVEEAYESATDYRNHVEW